jgi:cytochrome bd ubiquinol oxidase subunit II
MSFTLLSNIWFFLMALVWTVYIVQESFIIGGSILSFRFKNEKDYHDVNHLVGTHWDGIQVWLILAVAGLFASFPRAFGSVLSNLYIPFFLLLYAIIFRGVSIELVFKSENKRYQKIMKTIWSISSFVLFLVIGIYITNTFLGLPIENGTMNTTFFSFMVIFNKMGLYGGLLFISHSLVAGTCFLQMNAGTKFIEPIEKIGKVAAVVSSVILALLFMGFNIKNDMFNGGLYEQNPIFWALPVGAMLLMMLAALCMWLNKFSFTFILSSLSMALFIFTGYTMTFPYIIMSSISPENGMLISEGASGATTLTVMFYGTLIFLPIVIGYQVYKYIRFWGDKS